MNTYMIIIIIIGSSRLGSRGPSGPSFNGQNGNGHGSIGPQAGAMIAPTIMKFSLVSTIPTTTTMASFLCNFKGK